MYLLLSILWLIRPIVTDVSCSLICVCVLGNLASPAKTPEPIGMAYVQRALWDLRTVYWIGVCCAHRRHLSNTIDRFVSFTSAMEPYAKNYFAHCYYCSRLQQLPFYNHFTGEPAEGFRCAKFYCSHPIADGSLCVLCIRRILGRPIASSWRERCD